MDHAIEQFHARMGIYFYFGDQKLFNAKYVGEQLLLLRHTSERCWEYFLPCCWFHRQWSLTSRFQLNKNQVMCVTEKQSLGQFMFDLERLMHTAPAQ